MSSANIGDRLFLSALLVYGENALFVRAVVYDENNNQVPGSPFSLSNVSGGYYVNNSGYLVQADDKKFSVVYSVYEDSGHTVLSSVYGPTQEIIDVTVAASVAGGGGGCMSLVGTIYEGEVISGVIAEDQHIG